MQVAHSLFSVAPLLLVLGIAACGNASDADARKGSNATNKLGVNADEDKPVVAGLGDYVSPGASADTIMKVAREGNAEMVKLLIGESADVDFALPDGLAVLHVAVDEGHMEVVKVLLENKANPNPRQAAGATPLILALQSRDIEMVKLLLASGADPNIGMLNGTFSLMMFDVYKWDRKQQLELANLLLEAGADLNQRIGPGGNTALMVYAANGNTEMLSWLLEHKVKLNLKGDKGYSALAFAAVTNQNASARLLVEAGADLTITNKNGDTPAKIAERTQQKGVAEYLRAVEAERAKKSGEG